MYVRGINVDCFNDDAVLSYCNAFFCSLLNWYLMFSRITIDLVHLSF